MDADQRCELDAVLLLVGLKVGRRLEVVSVEVLVAEGKVKLHKVRELSHLELNAFLFELRLDEVEDVGVRHRRCADTDHVGSGGSGRKGSAGKDGGSGCAGEGFQGMMKIDMDRLREAVRLKTRAGGVREVIATLCLSTEVFRVISIKAF